jgi:hypothetical protein
MDPITAAAPPDPTVVTDPAATATAAEFQQAFDQVLTSIGTGVVSIALEDLIQIFQEEL